MEGNNPVKGKHNGWKKLNKIIDKFQQIGLTGREAEVYFVLLQKKELTASEISKVSSVSRTKSYEILQNLVKKNVCDEYFKNGIKVFSAIEPTIALQNILSFHEQELNSKKKIISEVKDDLVKLFLKKQKVNAPLDYIEILSDPGQIRQKWLKIVKQTKKELLAFTKPPYTKAINDNIENETLLIKRKVSVKGVYEYKDLETREDKIFFSSVVENYQTLGEGTRIVKELPMKLIISDELITMFALNDRVSLNPSITTLVVNHPNFALALKKVFESYWNTGITIEEFKRTFIT